MDVRIGLGLLCLTLFQQYFSYIGGGNRITQVTDTLYHIMSHRADLVGARFELQTLVVISTDRTGSCKSNYHTITITTDPEPQNTNGKDLQL